MKKLLLVIAALPLVACFEVDDFGAYWDKAGTDKRLVGTWKQTSSTSDQSEQTVDPSFDDSLRFAAKGGAFEISLNGAPLYPVKTVKVGRYDFLVVQPKKGVLQRYTVSGHTLQFCDDDADAIEEFIKTHDQQTVNVQKTRSEGNYLEISLLDDRVFTILSKVPDTKAYWVCELRYERIP